MRSDDLRGLKDTSRKPSDLPVSVTSEERAEGQRNTTSYLRLVHRLAIQRSLLKPVGVRVSPAKLAQLHRAFSSTNLAAISRLTSAKLPDAQRIKPGDVDP
jgi:hypothetical protein